MTRVVHETITVERSGHVAWVTLNRPQVHNAFNAAMLREVRDLWRSLRSDDEIRCVVLTGAGEEAFCTGIDRAEAMTPRDGDERPVVGSPGATPFMFDDPGDMLGPKSNDLWTPVVAAVNGMACGGAFYLLGEADIIIASEGATFFDPHVSYGMTASFESMHILQRIPLGEAIRMQLMGNRERMSARRAYEIGLVSEVVPQEGLRDAASWIADGIASAPPLAVQGTLRALWTAQDLPRRQALAQASAYVKLGTNRDSIREGQEAFASGTRPKWRLR